MKAVIKTGGKQYYVSENDVIYVEKLNGSVGDTVVFDEVLALDSKIGNPLIKGAKVTGKIEKQGKAKKTGSIEKFNRKYGLNKEA